MRHGLRSDLITQNLLYTNNDNELFFDRELSWLSFNERVIKTSTNKNIPLAERLRFLIISSYNLDEFYMVHIALEYLTLDFDQSLFLYISQVLALVKAYQTCLD